MPTFQHSYDKPSDFITALEGFQDGGIDPAFDSDTEELDRQFAEFRFAAINE
jgi:hypothetical protein